MSRRYGQHFLRDKNILEKIVEASGVGTDDAVLEIGPGEGVLTRSLAARCRKVLAIEVDRALVSQLAAAELPSNVEVRQGDALELTDDEIRNTLGESYALVSNLPYEITSATLQSFLTRAFRPKSITLLIQKEVVERIVGKGGSSRLSVFCGYHALPQTLFTVSRGSFDPPPKVESAVIRLELRPKRLLEPDAETRFFGLVEAAFAQKRKKLANTLGAKLGLGVENILEKVGISPSARPEEISLEQWMELAKSV